MRNLIKWAFRNETPLRLVLNATGVKGFVAVRHTDDIPRLRSLIYSAVESTVGYDFHCRCSVTKHDLCASQQGGNPNGIP